jgi:hypothetical protein
MIRLFFVCSGDNCHGSVADIHRVVPHYSHMQEADTNHIFVTRSPK